MKTIQELREMSIIELKQHMKEILKTAYIMVHKVKQGLEKKTHLPKMYRRYNAKIQTIMSQK